MFEIGRLLVEFQHRLKRLSLCFQEESTDRWSSAVTARWKTLEGDVTAPEYALQTALFAAGFPVPEPLLLDVSGSVLPSPYLVMEMVEGTTVLGALQYIPSDPSYSNLHDAVARWMTKSVASTLLHRDFWPGNILWRDQKIAAVIDWEDGAIGSALSDLAECRSEIMAIYGGSSMEGFTTHYRAGTTCDLTDLPLWEVYAGYAALATMRNS
jgi:aminoglycoside phosphotransferase (APT) family kinase protein